ncbi:MAG: hypothetical protein WBA76_10470 [Phormidesmis sp.]
MANFLFILELPRLALPWVELPDSLDTLTTLASQIQTVVSLAIGHPLWAIAAVLLTIVLIQIIADLIKRVLKASLAFVIKLPLMLSQWLWKKATASPQPSQVAQVDRLITRLDALREEQDQVVAELKNLLLTTQQRSENRLESALVSYPTVTAEDKSSSMVSPETG